MAVKHICVICGNKGRLRDGKKCPLCGLVHSTRRIFSPKELADIISPDEVIVGNPLTDFPGEQEDFFYESREDLKETDSNILRSVLREKNRKLVSIAARIAEQRAAYLKLSRELSKYPETRDIAGYIEKAYHKMRSSWLLIEKTQEMVSRRLTELS